MGKNRPGRGAAFGVRLSLIPAWPAIRTAQSPKFIPEKGDLLTSRPDSHRPSRRLYGRRKGSALSPRRQALVKRLLPELALDINARCGETGKCIDTGSLFHDACTDLWVEIGFGMGEHLAAQALAHPAIGFIGCEPYVNGVAGLLSLVDEGGMRNVRIYCDNALNLLERLPAASVGRVFLLHPDPWPKKRHAGRRFITPENMDIVARVLRPEGEFRFQTDDPGYLRWAMAHLSRRRDFEWLAEHPADWRQRPGDWPPTRYEAKAQLSGRRSYYLCFRRLASPDPA